MAMCHHQLKRHIPISLINLALLNLTSSPYSPKSPCWTRYGQTLLPNQAHFSWPVFALLLCFGLQGLLGGLRVSAWYRPLRGMVLWISAVTAASAGLFAAIEA